MKIILFKFTELNLISFHNNFMQADMQIHSNYIYIFNINNILCIFNEHVNFFVYKILANKLNVVIFFIVEIKEINIILTEL